MEAGRRVAILLAGFAPGRVSTTSTSTTCAGSWRPTAKRWATRSSQVAIRAGHDPSVAARHYSGRVVADRSGAGAGSRVAADSEPPERRYASGYDGQREPQLAGRGTRPAIGRRTPRWPSSTFNSAAGHSRMKPTSANQRARVLRRHRPSAHANKDSSTCARWTSCERPPTAIRTTSSSLVDVGSSSSSSVRPHRRV